MKLEERVVSEAAGTILLHNVADVDDRRSPKKRTRLSEEHLAQLESDRQSPIMSSSGVGP